MRQMKVDKLGIDLLTHDPVVILQREKLGQKRLRRVRFVRVMDEVEAAGAELGSKIPRLGFYSYGEISPHGAAGVCQLHNQTMTVTAFTAVFDAS